MDFETQRKKRLEALEEKKKRLEEMKKLKQERDSVASTSIPQSNNNVASSQERNDVDDLINSLLLSAPNAVETPQVLSDSDKKNLIIDQSVKNVNQTKKTANLTVVKSVVSFEIFPTPVESYEKFCQTDDMSDMNGSVGNNNNADDRNYDSTPQKLSHRRPATTTTGTSKSTLIRTISTSQNVSTDPSGNMVGTELSNNNNNCLTTLIRTPLTDEEIKKVIKTEGFINFLDNSSHIIERAIGQSNVFDLLQNYKSNTRSNDQKNANKGMIPVNMFEDESVKNRAIMDIQFSPHFPELFLVAYGSKMNSNNKKGGGGTTTSTSMTNRSNLNNNATGNSNNSDEPLGMVCIWSTGIQSKPEFKFYASSPVLTARFSATDEHIIVGGCYTGQILLWDMRMKSQPIQRSSLTGRGHKHPVYSMYFVPSVASTPSTGTSAVSGSGNSNNDGLSLTSSSSTTTVAVVSSLDLITVSVDGVVCYWDVSRLTEPSSIMNLATLLPTDSISSSGSLAIDTGSASGGSTTSTSGPLPLNITCMSFGSNISDGQAPKDIVFGSGTGQIYRGGLPLRPNQFMSQFDAHSGLISSMQINPSTQRQFKSLLLTSSLDWTIKLWSFSQPPNSSSSSSSYTSGQQSQLNKNSSATTAQSQYHQQLLASSKPLFEFISPTYDYVSDVQWCPTHPAVFSTITSCGHLSLWNLCRSSAEPVETISLNSGEENKGISNNTTTTVTTSGGNNVALNKSMWSNNGRILLVGDSKGCVYMITVQDNMTTFSTTDENKLEMLLLGNSTSTSSGDNRNRSELTTASSVTGTIVADDALLSSSLEELTVDEKLDL